MDFLIKNADVVNEGKIFVADVLVSGGKITKVGQGLEASGARVIDATGKYLIPGVIDSHVHFREPGLTQKADISTESRAAVAGGVTSFMDMPNTVPQTTTREILQQKFNLAAEKSLANYSFYIGATNDNLLELLECDFSKVCGIKLFMGSSTGNMLVDSADSLEALFRESPCLIAAHCEDEQVIRKETSRMRALIAESRAAPSASIHPYIRTAEACYRSSSQAAELAAKTGARLHILHISTARELSLFRNDIPLEQKKITAETCPHYLLLDSRRYDDMGFSIKCNPAIKSSADREALLKALGNGLIDTVGTDHAPHLWAEKDTADYFTAKSGFPSVQHSLQLMESLVSGGWITLQEIVRLMCHNPATLYRIAGRGFIREGYCADLAILDPSKGETISNDGEFSKCGWSPYESWHLTSKVTHTFVNGNLVYENGLFHEDSRGESLTFNLRN